MEVANQESEQDRLPVSATAAEVTSLDIIRTETVLSRLPVHNLAKRGNVNIQILKTTPDGKLELKWIVSYSDRYGQARQLAYKLDTIVINRYIDEQGRPLPKMICLGSLRDVADQLDLGGDTNKVRRALRQNASAFITAKFEYGGNDGSKKTLEADFTRYSVVFTGEQLPDGRKADAVYIILNEPYRDVLNNAPVRPLDRAYMKELPPAAQRFYEIISYKMFSALKNDYPYAKLSYSDYCTYSAQVRHFKRQPVQDQIAKVLRPHKLSGYITEVRYEPKIDAQNQPDWNMYLTPGPKARAEFAAAHGKRIKVTRATPIDGTEVGDYRLRRRHLATQERRSNSQPVAPAPTVIDPALISEFTNRGVTEKKARELLAHLKPGQDVLAQLELGDQFINKNPAKYTNPSGFYIHLVEENTPLPKAFETKAQKKKREADEQRREDERRAQLELDAEYQWYCDAEIDRFIAALDPAEIADVREAKQQEMQAKHQNAWIIEKFSEMETRRELAKRVPLMSIEEFKASREQVSAPESETSEPLIIKAANVDIPPTSPQERTPADQEQSVTTTEIESQSAEEERGDPKHKGQESESKPPPGEQSVFEPLLTQLVAAPPKDATGTDPIGESLASRRT